MFAEVGGSCRLFSLSSKLSRVTGASKSRLDCQTRTYAFGATQSNTHSSLNKYQITKRPLAKNQLSNVTYQIEAKRRGIDALQKATRAADLEIFQTRRWKEGDVYAPHDLSWAEMRKNRKKGKLKMDAFDALAINPMDEYKNVSIMWEYCSSMGKILHRNETGLRPVNQRRISKAIRRAVSMGLMPSVHKHPEILEAEAESWNNRRAKSGGI